MQKSREKLVVYEKRIIAFIDILGFKNLVLHQELDKLDVVVRKLKYEFQNNYNGSFFDGAEFKKEVTWFSDSIVMSIEPSAIGDLTSAFYLLLMDMYYFQTELLTSGILCRGGIAYGDVLHNKETIIGPSMIAAYLIESTQKEPTIKIHKDTRQELIKDCDSDQKMIFDKLLVKHGHSPYYSLNFMMADDIDVYKDYKVKVAAVIHKGLQHADTTIKEKYEWLYDFYQYHVENNV